MKNKTVIILLSVLAVAMYTAAVINFCLGDVLDGIGDVLDGIGDVLMASFGALMAYALYHVGQLGRMAGKTRKAVTIATPAAEVGITVDLIDPKLADLAPLKTLTKE